MHFYLIRVNGVRSERNLGLLTMKMLPNLLELPPLFVYPHGIIQREVEIFLLSEGSGF